MCFTHTKRHTHGVVAEVSVFIYQFNRKVHRKPMQRMWYAQSICLKLKPVCNGQCPICRKQKWMTEWKCKWAAAMWIIKCLTAARTGEKIINISQPLKETSWKYSNWKAKRSDGSLDTCKTKHLVLILGVSATQANGDSNKPILTLIHP